MSEATLVLDSTLTCPACGVAKLETMPIDACHGKTASCCR
jgi:hypothetical protein